MIQISQAAIALLTVAAGVAYGQGYPNRPLQMLTSEPGGGNDFAARLIAQGLTANLGQQVLVVNRGAAGGVVAAEAVARAAPDGYTLLFYGSNIWLLPFLRSQVPYDPLRDFAPVTLAVSAPILLLVHPSLPVKSVRELIALAKARPGALNYGSGASGSATQIATEMFKAMAGIDIAKISYKGNGPALNALIAGEVQMALATPGSVSPHVKSGEIEGAGGYDVEAIRALPRLADDSSFGIGWIEAASIVGAFAPAKTPAAIVSQLNQEFVHVLNRADVKEKFLKVGVETVGSTPEEFGARVKSEMARLGKVIRDAGIRE